MMKQSKRYQRLAFFALLIVVVAVLFLSYSTITSPAYPTVPGMAYVQGGKLHTEDPETSNSKDVVLKPFLLHKNVVTVADFDAFGKATGYVTEAEKFGNAGVFDKVSAGWILVDGANFHFPFGRDNEAAKPGHPVTQISWNDATAYAKWKGKRLPTQWEWEFAARNGENDGTLYSWGDQLVQKGKYKANTWQGSFPYHNTVEDGYEYTSPAGIFGPNKLGLTDMGGNVWQWCTDDIKPTATEAASDPSMRKVLRGGPFLCDPLVCYGFKVTGRSLCTAETALGHLGFRCAKDI